MRLRVVQAMIEQNEVEDAKMYIDEWGLDPEACSTGLYGVVGLNAAVFVLHAVFVFSRSAP